MIVPSRMTGRPPSDGDAILDGILRRSRSARTAAFVTTRARGSILPRAGRQRSCDYIAGLFDAPLDVIDREALKPHLRAPAARDMVYAF
jgi:hypothetical protein